VPVGAILASGEYTACFTRAYAEARCINLTCDVISLAGEFNVARSIHGFEDQSCRAAIDQFPASALEVTLRKLLLSSGTRSLARARRNVEIYLKDFIKVSKKFERQPEIHRYIRGISLSGLSSLFSPHNKWKSSRDTSRELPRRAAINLRNILSGVSLTVTADKSRFNRRRMYLISNEFTSFRLSRLPAAAAAAATAAAASSPRVLSR